MITNKHQTFFMYLLLLECNLTISELWKISRASVNFELKFLL